MSDAKKCDRCGNFYDMDDNIPERGKINNKIVNIIGAYQGGAVRCGYFDLCPECSKSFVNWFDKCMVKVLSPTKPYYMQDKKEEVNICSKEESTSST